MDVGVLREETFSIRKKTGKFGNFAETDDCALVGVEAHLLGERPRVSSLLKTLLRRCRLWGILV